MKILFTGGVTGGHFYPIIAVAQAVREHAKERRILPPLLYFMAPTEYNPRALFDNEIEYLPVMAGKIRRYFSILNLIDIFKTFFGCITAIFKVFILYPDVVFGKGGYGSFPALVAARILRIPTIIHESDGKPGRVNSWAGKFAEKVAISYPGAAQYFRTDKSKIAYTGNPVRKEIAKPLIAGAYELLHLEEGIPVILILGGSQGATAINNVILQILPDLVERFQIIHQTGKANIDEVKATSSVILKDNKHASRYHPMEYLNELNLRMAAGTAEIVISRAGSTIFEIASWGLPSIIIPLPLSVSHDQTTNALTYAQTGAASVIEEDNLGAHILIEEINRIHDNPVISQTMRDHAKAFSRPDSADKIADAILDIALKHEK